MRRPLEKTDMDSHLIQLMKTLGLKRLNDNISAFFHFEECHLGKKVYLNDLGWDFREELYLVNLDFIQ